MGVILTFLQSESCRQLVMTLLHSLWQGAALAALLWMILRALPAKSVGKRYAVSLFFLLALPLVMACTWAVLNAPDAQLPVTGQSAPQAPPIPPVAPASPSTSLAAPFPSPSESPRNWPAFVALIWLAGASLMLLRAATSVAGAHRLLRQCEPVRDPAVLAALEDVCRRLDLNRRVRILVGKVSSPAAIGLIWPAILLPGDLLSGLPSGQLRLILAHELAHIRRYDYLVNVLQLLLESLLFFNPAIWWISRQVRREREAACDALAVRLTGEPNEYARLLLVEATRVRNAALVSFSGEIEKPLSERVRRLLSDAYHPHAALPIFTFLGAFTLSLLCLALLCVGTSCVFSRILTPEQRINKIAEAEKTFVEWLPNYPENAYVKVVGTVITQDGGPVPQRATVQILSEVAHGTSSAFAKVVDGRFECSYLRAGLVSLAGDADGYAMTLGGRKLVAPNQTWTDAAVVLRRGFTARFRLVDTAGHSVAGAKVDALLSPNWSGMRLPNWHWDLQSDKDGRVNLEPFSGDLPARLTIVAPGYQHETVVRAATDGRVCDIVLQRATPCEGVVVDKVTGRPIPTAEVVADASDSIRSPQVTPINWHTSHVANHVDAEGRFKLDVLRDDCSYVLYARAEGYEPATMRDVETGQTTLRLALEPTASKNQPAQAKVGAAPEGAVIPAPPQEVTAAPASHVVESLATRSLLIRLLTPKDAPPKGAVTLWVPSGEPGSYRPVQLPVTGPEIRTTVSVPARLDLEATGLAGYSFERQSRQFTADGGELVWEIPVLPAGAVTGRVLDSDGQPMSRAMVFVSLAHPPPGARRAQGWGPFTGDDGRFIITPILLGTAYRLTAHSSLRFAVSREFTLDEKTPLREIDIPLPPGQKLRGTVLLPDGSPDPHRLVEFDYDLPDARADAGSVRTDRLGRFEIEGMNFAVPGKFFLRIHPRKLYREIYRMELKPGERDLRIVLERGVALRGRLVDADTGAPVVGVSVDAYRRGESLRSDEPTNENGEFVFTTMARAQYTLKTCPYTYGVIGPDVVGVVTAEGGQAEPVVIPTRKKK